MSYPASLRQAAPSDSFQTRMERKENKFKRDMCWVFGMMGAGAVCAIITVGWLLTASYLPIAPSIKLIVLGVSASGTFCFFSIGICLMNKRDAKDDRSFKKLKERIEASHQATTSKAATPDKPPVPFWRQVSTLPDQEVVVEEFRACSFKEFLKKAYWRQAFEKGYLSFEHADVRDKFYNWIATVPFSEIVLYFDMKWMTPLIPESEQSAAFDLYNRFRTIEREFDPKYEALYTEKIKQENALNEQARTEERALRRNAAALEVKIIRQKNSLISDPSRVQGLEEEQEDVYAKMRENKTILEVEKRNLCEQTRLSEAEIEKEFKEQCEPLEAEWSALRHAIIPGV